MLDAESDELCKAEKYHQSPERQSTRSGSTPPFVGFAAEGCTLQLDEHYLLPYCLSENNYLHNAFFE